MQQDRISESVYYTVAGLITKGQVSNWMNETTLLDDRLSGALNYAPFTAPGVYPITLGTLSAGSNYEITYNGALLTVKPAIPNPDPDPTPTPTPFVDPVIPTKNLDNLGVILNGTLPNSKYKNQILCNVLDPRCNNNIKKDYKSYNLGDLSIKYIEDMRYITDWNKITLHSKYKSNTRNVFLSSVVNEPISLLNPVRSGELSQ